MYVYINIYIKIHISVINKFLVLQQSSSHKNMNTKFLSATDFYYELLSHFKKIIENSH